MHHDIRRHRYLPITAADILLIFIIGFGVARVFFPVIIESLQINIKSDGNKITIIMAILAIQTLLLFGILYIIVVRLRGVTWAELGFTPLPREWIGRSLMLAVMSFPLVGAASWLQQQITGTPFENPQFQTMAPNNFSWLNYIITLSIAGIIAPIVEETIFRGLLYRWLHERTSYFWAILGSSFVFSFLHGIPSLIPGIMILGILLAWIYQRVQSIWAPILVHGTYNAIVTTALYAALAQGISPPGT